MDDESMNRYEKQLYTVFKTFDVDNEEALDRSAVHELCDALQLEDRGAALVHTLFERRSDRVTFAQFRNGLLSVLDGSSGSEPALPNSSSPSAPPQSDPPPQQSDDDSSGREVAPKFVFGSKKYGRRSRPPRVATTVVEPVSPRSLSASRVDTDDKRARQRMRCRRSTSAMESRHDSASTDMSIDADTTDEPFEHDRRIDRDEALALCRGLHMDGIDPHLVERIFEDTGTTDTTVGEFFDRLNSSLTTTIEESSRESRVSAASGDISNRGDDEAGDGVPSELVLEAWERAGVQQPRRLLLELGFVAPTLCPPELERALDDEMRALPDTPPERREARTLLLAAALALSRLSHELDRRRAELTIAERDKLRGDVTEANRRARILAQEVDESHARIECELKANVRRAELRQTEAARQAASEIAAERERAALTRARLEVELARRGEAEVRARSDAQALQQRAEELEAQGVALEERAAAAEREGARLASELRAALERGAAAAARGDATGELTARLTELRDENKVLRDRNDELCAALEAAERCSASRASDLTHGGDLSAELNSILPLNRSEECDSSPVSIDQRFLGHVESLRRIKEVFEKVNTMPRVDGGTCELCGPISTAIRQLQEQMGDLDYSESLAMASMNHISTQTEPVHGYEALGRELMLDQQQKDEEEKQKLTGLVKELEMSLEQMKAEYDKCEEYWSNKLDEEREAYNEEQRIGDERLVDLVAKISEYERQFARAPQALPTIDERHSLEAQFTDLEDEFAAYRRSKEAELQASLAENARLAERLEALERRLASAAAPRAASPVGRRRRSPGAASPAPGAEVRELRARCGRAEAAVRRLHARLQAADVLVKDLYVENCQLAHRRPL